MGNEVVFLNLSGNLLTDKDKPFSYEQEIAARLAKEISEAYLKSKFNLVIGTGSGSFGNPLAKKYNLMKGVDKAGVFGFAETQDAAARLNRLFVAELLKNKVPAVSLQPSAAGIAKEGKLYSFFTDYFKPMFELGMVPVVYGDVLIDLTQGSAILTIESLARYLIKYIKFDRVIMATKADGIYSEDPAKNPSATFYPRVDSKSLPYIKHTLVPSEGIDVSGGMRERVEKGYELARSGAACVIISGLVENRVKDALLGKNIKGTTISV